MKSNNVPIIDPYFNKKLGTKKLSRNENKHLLVLTKSFLAKTKDISKIIKSKSSKSNSLILNNTANEDFTYLDYKNRMCDNILEYMKDLSIMNSELNQLSKIYANGLRVRRYFTTCHPQNNTNIHTINRTLKFNSKTKNSEYNLNARKDQFMRNYGSQKISQSVGNKTRAFTSKFHTLCNSRHNSKILYSKIEPSITNSKLIFIKSIRPKTCNKQTEVLKSHTKVMFDFFINRKSKEKINEINYELDNLEERIIKK